MNIRQREELIHLERIQRTQFEEFTSAWDQYMMDYEIAAYESIERMK